LGAFQLPQKYWAVLGATGIVLGAVYMLWLYQRTMFGKLDRDENRKLIDLNFREIMTLLPLTVLAFWIGLYPKPIFDIIERPIQRLVQQIDKTIVYPSDIAGLYPAASPEVATTVDPLEEADEAEAASEAEENDLIVRADPDYR
jgi:NADH-quinone oxidoreductase subunit M